MYQHTIKPTKAIKSMVSDGATMVATGFRVGKKSMGLLDIAVDDFIVGAQLSSKNDRLEDLETSFEDRHAILERVAKNSYEAEFLAQAKDMGLLP